METNDSSQHLHDSKNDTPSTEKQKEQVGVYTEFIFKTFALGIIKVSACICALILLFSLVFSFTLFTGGPIADVIFYTLPASLASFTFFVAHYCIIKAAWRYIEKL